MKRLVAVVVFALASVAQAETLLPIVQAEGGDRWVLDNDSIEFVGMTAAWRVYVYPSEGGQRIPKIIAVDVPGCFAGRGELTIYTHVNGSIRPSVKFWTPDGDKVYDAMGKRLCPTIRAATKDAGPKEAP